MKKIFYKVKSKVSYFFWNSKMPFFATMVIWIFVLFVFLIYAVVVSYDEKESFFEICRNFGEERSLIFEQKKIYPEFKENGEISIVKSELIDLDFEKLSFEDNYLAYEYKIIFPGDYLKFFENNFYSVKNDFIDSIYIENDDGGKTVLRIKETDIFAFDAFNEENCAFFVPVSPREYYDNILVVDAGHGGMDFGVGNGDVFEKNIALEICKKIDEKLKKSDNVKVYLTRNDDYFLKDEERAFFANQYADFLLSIHVNSFDNFNFSDKSNIFYFSKNGNETDSENFAKILYKNFFDTFSFEKEFNVFEDNNFLLEKTEIPSVMIEFGCYDLEKKSVDENFFDDVADVIVKSVGEIFENED